LINMNPTQTPAQFLAAQFLAAYEEAERTGESIEEIARLDVLATVARQVVADVAREEEAAARIPQWRVAADAHSTCEFARMAQMEIMKSGADTTVIEVCDYVTACAHAFEARYRDTEWGEDYALDWMDATADHWEEYTAAHRPPWDTDDARREREAESMRAALRASSSACAAGESSRLSVMAALVHPGTIALTRIFSRANSTARPRAIADSAALAAA
jgi:hypothetical protein